MKLNLKRLNSIQITLEAIEDIDLALKEYEKDLPGPAYMTVKMTSREDIQLQFERDHFRQFMIERRQQLIRSLELRFDGFEYEPAADWRGDHIEVDNTDG